MARSHLNEHTLRIRKRLVIPKTQIQTGMVVEARYRPQEGEAKRYMLLILQPRYLNQVHALTLDNFSFIMFDSLAKKQGLKYIPSFQRYKGLDISKMQITESPKNFYSKILKSGMDSVWNRAYRTMDVKSFSTINLVDYNFSGQTEAIWRLQSDSKEENK